jgi:hypothetical protein
MQGDVERAIVRGLYEAVAAYNQTKDPAHLIKLAADATATFGLYEDDAYAKALLSAPERPGDPHNAVEVAEVLARLRSSN